MKVYKIRMVSYDEINDRTKKRKTQKRINEN